MQCTEEPMGKPGQEPGGKEKVEGRLYTQISHVAETKAIQREGKENFKNVYTHTSELKT